MKTLVVEKPYTFKYEETNIQKPRLNTVTLRVLAVGICGTDIHAYTGNQPFFTYPRVLGHEVCGEITEVGENVTQWKQGDRVALIPYVSCQVCPSCQSGRPNCCENISVIGVHENGGFCEYLNVPASQLLSVSDVEPSTAALIEPFAISAHAVRRANVQKGQDILVVGAGPIGLGAAAIAKSDGANVIVADTSEERRKHIEKVVGVKAITPDEEAVRECFSGALALTVIDATGNANAMNNAVNLIRNGGTIVYVGLHKGNLEISDPDFHKKETTLMGSRNATLEDFEKVARLMASKDISAEMMLTHSFMFSELAEIYQEQVIDNKQLLKAVILMSE
ncbi:galactonate oxidoreductase [Photobacterium angustum]|uniref:zinc-binding alcohol dehydrogenase family protein n=1 Tax=Photobacterium angustum TaxID=661 RepID=UPI0005E69E9D|nr:zinc-binding alcohol dehydrogenase family protein [Photobacterium angustum]KJG05600.1 galactonate oxidoreductase [Photobacterium angustum]PSV91077.1 galactonate oxidoreductase [Photobacterium angustum]